MSRQLDIKHYKKQITFFMDDLEALKHRYDFSGYHFNEFGGIFNDNLDDLIEQLKPFSEDGNDNNKDIADDGKTS